MLIDFRQLFPKHNIKPNGVLHVGANIGEEASVYDELGIKEVHWIEANPYIIEKLNANVSKYGHETYNFAASDEDGNVILHESSNSSQSSSILELGTHKVSHPEVNYVRDISVPMFRISYFAELFEGLDFLNMDIQGAELKALKGMGNMLYQFKWAYLEVNQAELYKGCALVGEIDEYMEAFRFKRVETKWCGNTGWGDALYIK